MSTACTEHRKRHLNAVKNSTTNRILFSVCLSVSLCLSLFTPATINAAAPATAADYPSHSLILSFFFSLARSQLNLDSVDKTTKLKLMVQVYYRVMGNSSMQWAENRKYYHLTHQKLVYRSTRSLSISQFTFLAESFADARVKLYDYALQIPRPAVYRYNPYTQSVETLSSKKQVASLTKEIKSDLALVIDGLRKIWKLDYITDHAASWNILHPIIERLKNWAYGLSPLMLEIIWLISNSSSQF